MATNGGAQAQSDKRIVYFSSDRQRTVQLSHAGAGIVTFTVPVGTMMAVSYMTRTAPNLTAPKFEAHGAVRVRLLPDTELRGAPLAEAMLLAPVMFGGDNVDLVVQRR
jgi:hypothetical protein